MIIQALHIFGLLGALAYAFVQPRRSRLASRIIMWAAVLGIYLVVLPKHAAILGEALGVDCGADLVLYCWILIVLVLLMNVGLKILGLETAIATLTRELALRAPQRRAGNGDDWKGA
jgi:hypothetical protein